MTWETVDVRPIQGPDGRTTVPDDVIHSMECNKVGLKGRRGCWEWFVDDYVGPLETQIGKGAVSLNLTLRR